MSERRTSAIFDPVRVLAVIAAALLVAGIAFEVGHATRSKKKESAASTSTTVKPAVLGTQITAPDETTTTVEPAQPATTAAGVAAGSTATTATTKAPAPATPATTAAPRPTTTTQPPRSCGNGTASAQASNSVSPGDQAGTWKSSGEADVANRTDRTLVIDKLTLRLNFSDGSSETFTPDGAIGAQVQPSQIRGFPFTRTTAKKATTVDIIEFAAHPSGSGPECESQPA
jgi:hypothetical protein